MGALSKIKAAAKARMPARIASFSTKAALLAFHLNRSQALDPAIKRKTDAIRARMAKETGPWPHEYGGFATIAEACAVASSKDRNLAMLVALVRWKGSPAVLEIGTAFGISGAAMALAGARLTTIEGFEPQATYGPENIAAARMQAECIHGRKETELPRLASEGRRFDMIFHDGGHLGDAYVDDFNAMVPMLAPGALFVIDNVFHDDSPKQREFTAKLSRRTCREGWNELLSEPRVEGALIYGGSVGILLTR